MSFNRWLIRLGIHGKRHKLSKVFVNLNSYDKKQLARIDKMSKWCHDNGVGA